DDLMRPCARGAGHEADTTGVVLTVGVERRCGRRRCVRIETTGTGRVDPLPRGGHGTSCEVRPFRPERPAWGTKKTRSVSGAGRECAFVLAYPAAPTERTRLTSTVAGARRARFMNELLCTPMNPSSGAATTKLSGYQSMDRLDRASNGG